jgi:hypothetical protein
MSEKFDIAIEKVEARINALITERDDAISSKEHTQQWYAERLVPMKDWARGLDEELKHQFFGLLANGIKTPFDPPTYAQILNMEKWKRKDAEQKVIELHEQLCLAKERIADLDEAMKELLCRICPEHMERENDETQI